LAFIFDPEDGNSITSVNIYQSTQHHTSGWMCFDAVCLFFSQIYFPYQKNSEVVKEKTDYRTSNPSFMLPTDVNKLSLHVDCYIDSHTRDLAITPEEGCGVLIAPLMGMLTAAPPSATAAGVSKGTFVTGRFEPIRVRRDGQRAPRMVSFAELFCTQAVPSSMPAAMAPF
jgi:hypothetical protein